MEHIRIFGRIYSNTTSGYTIQYKQALFSSKYLILFIQSFLIILKKSIISISFFYLNGASSLTFITL